MKRERQDAILNFVQTQDIYTQGELTQQLELAGFSVTQATVSRDIRELKLTREPADNGLKYAAPSSSIENPLRQVFKNGLRNADYAGNTLVLHTLSGMAMAVATALDDMKLKEILGTIAGDDTIICIVRSEAAAKDLTIRLMEAGK